MEAAKPTAKPAFQSATQNASFGTPAEAKAS
jgi:hypothetical protein